MLTRIRIEVTETTAEQAVAMLSLYEESAKEAEAVRYELGTAEERRAEEEQGKEPRWPLDTLLGRELGEEVIEYDESVHSYRARRVVRFTRIDTRAPILEVMGLASTCPPTEGVGISQVTFANSR